MASPRIKCLDITRQVVKKPSGLRSFFSTSRNARAEDEGQSASAEDLLRTIGDPSSSSSPNLSMPPRPRRFQNPIPVPNRHQGPQQGNPQATKHMAAIFANSVEKRKQNRAKETPLTSEELRNNKLAGMLSKQITRRFKSGDVYAPHDLSAVEMSKWRSRGRPLHDAFDVLDLNPLDHYRNFSMMSEYMTPMGRIQHSNVTGLRPVNQRRIARAIRRTIGMGMMPSVHRHPEILQKLMARQQSQGATGRRP